ncbi:MAG: preprotein translocase subunit SecA [Eubacterium sp.]|nr:preprotein translocase subunit SecA [Eubacterium sp.]
MVNSQFAQLIKEVRAHEDNEISALMEDGGMAAVFAACSIAAQQTLSITPYDEQLAAAAELADGKIIEMATGEGKTLSAVLAACYQARQGHAVHVLTFNDYLAKRDFGWMKPIYDLCGITVSYISQDMDHEQRKTAYGAQVTYVTARECGFDFLRDFVAQSPELCVHRGFDCAIVDEADSILIDEGRVPLVIAGQTAVTPDADLKEIYEKVSGFDGTLYEINDELETIYLTPKGEDECERAFTDGTGLYDEENNELLTKITDCLRAAFLLKKDVNYIVKDGEIRIIDEFTGRAAQNRRYPGSLQAAVEIKENIESTTRGVIMGVVPIQFFVRQYQHLAGMTGTAKSSEDEFYQLYDLKVSVMNTHLPCRRTDYPNEIYATKAAKNKAVIDRIVSAHEKGQPVLIGTPSIDASEELYEALKAKGIEANVLNAKNDELEAQIIKDAGKPGAVTVSANMSGRGVDIKLGGADGAQSEEAEAAGGLLIIGTYLSENTRGDRQLRGRSGRQGDPGESRFYASLEDDIMIKYDLRSLISKRHYPEPEDETGTPITDRVVLRETDRIQRIAQGDTLELRRRLLKFTMIGEKHRETVFGRRRAFLTGEKTVSVWQDNFPELYETASEKFGTETVDDIQHKLILSVINEFWSDYLDYTSYLRDGIHLTRIGGKNPADEYNIACEEFFSGMEEQLIDSMGEQLEKLISLDSADDFKINNPTALWTYVLNESGEELLKKSFIQTALQDNEIDEYYGDEYDDGDDEEPAPSVLDASPSLNEDNEDKPKKGFFSKLFGKK